MLHDKDIREPLFEFLEQIYGKVRIIEEKTMGRSRADVVMVTENALFGIEIKSDADTYDRLSSQVRDYDKYYDYNVVVVGTSHAMHIEEHVPSHWGIITTEFIDGNADFYMLRKPTINTGVTWKKKLEILWRPELAQLQETFKMPKYKEKSKAFVIGKIVEWIENGKIEKRSLGGEVSNILFERDYNEITETLADYRKGEIEKKLETEMDIIKRVELMAQRAVARSNLSKRTNHKHKGRHIR